MNEISFSLCFLTHTLWSLMKSNRIFVSPGTKSYHKQLGKINTKIQKYGMWTQTCVLCTYFSKIFVISYNDWIKIWTISLYFIPVCHDFLKRYSGTINTWNSVSQLLVHYKSCHNMLNMYLNQIICLSKQHVSSNVHEVNFVSCIIPFPVQHIPCCAINVQERFFRPCRQYDWTSVCMAYVKERYVIVHRNESTGLAQIHIYTK